MPFQEIKERQGDQNEERDRQPKIDTQPFGQNRVSEILNGCDFWKHRRVGRAVNQSARQETE